jgi:hypothetical protein
LKVRLALVRRIASGEVNAGSELFNYELAAVSLRKSLELIAFGSLTANKDAYSQVHESFAQDWNAKKLLKKLAAINPDFYPKPVWVVSDEPGPPRHLHFDFVQDGFMSRDEFIELYDRCSEVIHHRNPFEGLEPIAFRFSVTEWAGRVENLLNMHLVRLAGSPEIWLVRLNVGEDNHVHASIASPS